MSLGTSSSSDGTDTVSTAVNRAAEAGLIPVVAAGNSGPGRYTIGSPGAAEQAITVGAMADVSEEGFSLAAFSSRGPTRDDRTKPDIAAPGVAITAPRAGSGDGYIALSGTSMATPFVSGVIALMLDANPDLTVEQVRTILAETAEDWGPPGKDTDYGWGRLDAHAAVRRAGNFGGGAPPELPVHLTIQGRIEEDGGEAEHPIAVSGTAYPLALTLLIAQPEEGPLPDLDLYLYDPDGEIIARSTGSARQEELSVPLQEPGTYRAVIRAYSGAGSYVLDVSGPIRETAPDPPPPPDPPPDPDRSHAVTRTGVVTAGQRSTDATFTVHEPGYADLELTWESGADLDFYVYAPDGRYVGRAFTLRNPERLRVDTLRWGTGAYRVRVHLYSGPDSPFTLTARGFRLTEATGSVSPEQPDSLHPMEITHAGQGLATLHWPGYSDLDFFLHDPEGQERARAYTLRNPETADLPFHRTGPWSLRVNLYSGRGADYRVRLFTPEAILS